MFSFKIDDELQIELIELQQKEELYELIDLNRNYLREWLMWVDKRTSSNDFDDIIPMWLSNYASRNGFDAGIRYNGGLVGMIGLHYIDWRNRMTSIGYFLDEKSQGNGIITRCISGLLPYLFETLQLNRVVIQCDGGNVKSKNVAKRLNFREEGIERNAHFVYDHYEDLYTYALLRKEWINNRMEQ
jgi:ribosomal-protein-serine acetyltransferase